MEDTVEFHDVEVRRETPLAIQCVIDEQLVWIPKSQITDDSEVYELGTDGTLVVTEWIAIEKGLV